jgi:anion-transporting  ArsA/GET3 family ATPase
MAVTSSVLDLRRPDPPLVVVVGSGGVGKTTLAAGLGLVSADAGHDTLVMTFDPSRRLKDTLGVKESDGDAEVPVDSPTDGRLHASNLDPRRTFDRLIERYAPDLTARDRILHNRYYDHLSGHLGGILEYMAVERLYEVSTEGNHKRLILDTPPTREAIDFLEAPQRIVDFLDSGALKIALRPWFGDDGHLQVKSGLGFVGRSLEAFLDRIVGVQLLRDMSEFFQAFGPLFPGFKERARKVRQLLASRDTLFVLVTGPGRDRIPDTLYFARRLREAGYHLGPVVVNRVHPSFDGSADPAAGDGRALFQWLGSRHHEAIGELQRRLTDRQHLVSLPLVDHEPTDLTSIAALGQDFQKVLLE